MARTQTDQSLRIAHESFLVHAGFRYLKVALLLSVAAIAAYIWHDPPGGPNGGTWLGYTLGTIGALQIAWLAWLGKRKRTYRSSIGTVRGWTSAHVYLGLSLALVATLHCAFHFGWNIHTLAYALTLAVIVSGIYGVIAYARYPSLITDNRAQATREGWLADLDDINDRSIKLADTLGPDVHRVIVASIDRIRIGGGVREILFGTREPERKAFEKVQAQLGETTQFMATQIRPRAEPSISADEMQSTVSFMAGRLAGGVDAGEQAQKLLDLLARRRDLTARINRDIRLQALMQVWLYVHVPLTFALLAALVAHIVSVFIYW